MGFFMAIKTTLEQLEEVQAAITAVMSGEEVAVGGKRLRMADLDALHRREEVLLKRYRSENSQGLTVVTGIMKRD
jgi:hypothetical protein